MVKLISSSCTGLKLPTSLWPLSNVPENNLPVLSMFLFLTATAFGKLTPDCSALPPSRLGWRAQSWRDLPQV